MRLKFDSNGGFPFELEVNSNDTLQEIKRKIQINRGFPISSQTLFFDGSIIANDADPLPAAITDGSQILLHIATAGDSTPPVLPPFPYSNFDVDINPSPSDFFNMANQLPDAAYFSTVPPLSLFQSPEVDSFSVDDLMNAHGDSAQPPPPPQDVFILLKPPEPFAAINLEATDNETILQIKQSIQEMTKVPVGRIVIKDRHGRELLDAMTLLQSQISNNSEVTVEFLQPPCEESMSSSSSSSTQPAPQPMRGMMRVVLEYNKVRVAVEVVAALKVGQLRSMLEFDARNFALPDPYFFIYKQAAVDENDSFLTENIAEGGIIEIFPGYVSGDMFLKLETSNHNPKAYFEVATHSDHTIRRLKEEIGRNEGIPVDRILIKRNGIEQPDHKALHACSITSDYGVTVEILEKKKKKRKKMVLEKSSDDFVRVD